MDALAHFSLRASLGRPGRTALTILSVIIAVSAVVAVSNASRTTRLAYKLMFSAVSGQAALEVARPGEEGFTADLVEQIEQLKDKDGKPLVKAAAPMLYSAGKLATDTDVGNINIFALSVDPIRDKHVRDFKLVDGRELQEEDDMLLDASFARSANIKLGDEVRLLGSKRGVFPFTVTGLVSPRSGAALRYSGMALINLSTGQQVFSKRGKVDRIQIVVPPEGDVQQVRQAIAPLLPEGVTIDSPQDNSAIMKENSLSSEEAIKLSRLFMLLLAIFIIFNAFLMNVGERRSQLAVIRAIGGTRRQVVWSLVRESLAMGLVGSVIGILLGFGLAQLVNLVLEILLQVELPRLPFSLEPIAMGLFFGMMTSFVAVIVPALMASLVTPLEGMRNITRSNSQRVTPWLVGAGFVITFASFAVLWGAIKGWVHIDLASFAGVTMVFGTVLLCPVVMPTFAKGVAGLLARFSRIEANLALRQLLRHNLRTALTMGVLVVAGSTGVGMASSLLDNIDDVGAWRRVAIIGDFFVRAAQPDMTTGTAPDLPDEVGPDIRAIPGITRLETATFVQGTVADQTVMVIAREYPYEGKPALDVIEGNDLEIIPALRRGEAVVGSVLASRLQVKLGQEVTLQGKDGPVQLKVAAIVNDYLGGGLSLHLHRETAVKLLGIQGYDSYIVVAEPERKAEVQAALQTVCEKYKVMLQSNQDVADLINTMTVGIVACLWVLVVIGFVVASFGVANTLTMNVLEQTRELGLLRITGMTRRQVLRTVLLQALILGGIGNTPGVLIGILTAWLINQAMVPSLGRPVQFQFHPWLLLFSWLGSLVIVLIAAIIPALRAARLNVVDALHYE